MNAQTKETTKSIVNIGGMACSGCANTVRNALNDLDGVQEASVNLDDDSASVTYDAGIVSTNDFRQAVENAGYEFKGVKN